MCPFHCGGVSSYVVVEIERDKITIDAIQPRDDKFEIGCLTYSTSCIIKEIESYRL